MHGLLDIRWLFYRLALTITQELRPSHVSYWLPSHFLVAIPFDLELLVPDRTVIYISVSIYALRHVHVRRLISRIFFGASFTRLLIWPCGQYHAIDVNVFNMIFTAHEHDLFLVVVTDDLERAIVSHR